MSNNSFEQQFDEPVQLADHIWWVGCYLEEDNFQSHQYLIQHGDISVLIDPGSLITFNETLSKIEKIVPFQSIRYFICQHQDPDITSALSLIEKMEIHKDAVIVSHWRAETLLKHYGWKIPFFRVEDNNWELDLGGRVLNFIYTPYLHFPGAFVTFDRQEGVLFSSDIFGGFTEERTLIAKDETVFDGIRVFHEHYMPSREILLHTLKKIESLPIRTIAPQHGSIITGDLVELILNKLKSIDCGLYLMSESETDVHNLSRINRLLSDIVETMLTHRDFRDIAEAILVIAKRVLPVTSLEFYSFGKERGLLHLANESSFLDEIVEMPDTLEPVFKMNKKSWMSEYNDIYYLDKSDIKALKLLTPLFSPGESMIKTVAIFHLHKEPLMNEEVIQMLKHMNMPLEVAIERELVLRKLDYEIKERMAAEENFRLAKEEAENATKAKSDFLAKMSHEIRTPMNGIIGTTSLVLKTDLTDKQREYIEMTGQSATALLTIINEILDISKIEAGKMELENIDFNLLYTIESVCDSMVYTAGKKEIDLFCHIKQSVPGMVKGDQVRLRQVLTNLVGNAIKFTEYGEIVVTAEREENYRTPGRENFLHFSVSDTGLGIREDKIATIFEDFSQADRSITRKYGGTGLGLTISKQLVNLMGGDMWVESDEGIGSVFHFNVSLGEASESASQPVTPDVLKAEGMNVLIVETSSTSRTILRDLMAEWNIPCKEATGGKEGLQSMLSAVREEKPFHTVLLSSRLPDMDSYDFVSKVKSNAKLANSKMILLATFKEGEFFVKSEEPLLESGFYGYLVMPYKRAKIIALLAGRRLDQLVAGTSDSSVVMETPLRVLLVEDNPVNQVVATGVLENMGHMVFPVGTGGEAIEKFESERFDIIFMDIELPDMSGIETTVLIRSKKDAQFNLNVPIIAMTAHAMKSDRERCIEAGMNGYLSKPFKAEDLAVLVSEHTSVSSQTEEEKPVLLSSKGTGHEEEFSEPLLQQADEHDTEELLDWQGALDGLDGNEELLKRIGSVFYDDIPRQFKKLEEAIENSDVELARRQAHSIKGASSNIRANVLKDTAYELEKAAQKGDMEESARISCVLKQDLEKVLDILKQPHILDK